MVGSGRYRSRSVPELLDAAIAMYRGTFLTVVAVAAMVAVPFSILGYLVNRIGDLSQRSNDLRTLASQVSDQGGATQAQHDRIVSDVGAFALVAALALVIAVVSQQLLVAAVSPVVSDRYLDRRATVAAAMRTLVARAPALLGGAAVEIAVVIGLLGVAVLPAVAGAVVVTAIAIGPALILVIIVAVRWQLMPQVVVLERLGPIAGLRRSWALTRTRFWRTVGVYLLFGLITAIASAVVAGLPALAASGASTDTQLLVSAVSGAVTSTLIAPVTVIGLVLYYYDIRIRTEAFDLEMLAATL